MGGRFWRMESALYNAAEISPRAFADCSRFEGDSEDKVAPFDRSAPKQKLPCPKTDLTHMGREIKLRASRIKVKGLIDLSGDTRNIII
jgi:hypothetical protein